MKKTSNLANTIRHQTSQFYDVFEDAQLIYPSGLCRGIPPFKEILPSSKEIIRKVRKKISFLKRSIINISEAEILITPFGKPLEEIIKKSNTLNFIEINPVFGIETFNDINQEIIYYPPFHIQDPLYKNTKRGIVNQSNKIFEISVINKSPSIHNSISPFEFHTSLQYNHLTTITLEDFLSFYIYNKYYKQNNINFKTPTLVTNSQIDLTQEFFLCYENIYQELIIKNTYMFNLLNYDFQTFSKFLL